MSNEIRDFAKSKGISFLLHFTRVDNLASIIQHGIIPVDMSAVGGVDPIVNDAQRFDYQRGATCVSIMFPNHRMFYKYRQDDAAVEWVVLALKPDVLWEKPCAFCQRNAADALITAVPIANRMTLAAFSGIYNEMDGQRTREEQKLKAFDPTHDQAEVLVFGVIEPELIVGAAFNSDAIKAKYESLLGKRKVVKCRKNGGFFGSRSFSREY